MRFRDVINEVYIDNEWWTRYRKFTCKFINEAVQGKDWIDWESEVFYEYFERTNKQCVASLQRGYFTNKEKTLIKNNWHKIAPTLKDIAINQDEMLIHNYQRLDNIINSMTFQHRQAATLRLIAGLQPNLLISLVSKRHMRETYKLLNMHTLDFNIKHTQDEYANSNNLLNQIKIHLPNNKKMYSSIYAWHIWCYLKEK